jgi:hypothetical protein
MGQAGRRFGTRELVLPPYCVIYRVHKGAISIEAVLHSARRH